MTSLANQTTIAHVNGVVHTNPITKGDASVRDQIDYSAAPTMWTTPGLKVTRLRLLSDPGYPFWDVSYCHGLLNGKPVRVDLPFSNLPKRGMVAAIVSHAKKDGVYAHGLGIISNISTLC